MARYKDAVCKLCRREREKLFLKGQKCVSEKCPVEKKPYPPGEHGQRRVKETQYLIQLREKQKAKNSYGVLEKQFRRYYEIAARKKGITGENLLQLLESRLDNIIYRAGFAASRADARQLVRHNHVKVNDGRVNIPSYLTKEGDVVAIVDKSKELLRIQSFLNNKARQEIPDWLRVDDQKLTVQINYLPARDDIAFPVKEQLIVELYSK
ncbi:hypothetical protein LCGC14_0847860 [marine sediment metagenome]|uniref:Uncharacterized protein n=1 Tax=marine sediment metagenome TaxID=412755 RepID=A0A0F9PFZ1_9ZZZZ|nr:30S ribosomal protein S4 [Actinomycetota bacterium]